MSQEISSMLHGCSLLSNVTLCYGCSNGDCDGCQVDDLRTAILEIVAKLKGSSAYYSAYYFSRQIDHNEDDVTEVLCDLVREGVLSSWFSGHCWLYAVIQ